MAARVESSPETREPDLAIGHRAFDEVHHRPAFAILDVGIAEAWRHALGHGHVSTSNG